MALFLLQHGLAHSKEIDPARNLSEEGIHQVGIIADKAARHNVKVSQIWHSGKLRAQQTAELMAEALQPEKGVIQQEGLCPNDDVTKFAEKIPSGGDDIMLTGHMPFMEKFAAYLISEQSDYPVIKFQNAGIVCLEQEKDTGYWYIKWTILPLIE